MHDPGEEAFRREAAIKDAINLIEPYNSERNIKQHEVMGENPTYIVGSINEGALFCGVRHARDIESPTIGIVEDQLTTYLDQVPPEKATIMIEGMHSKTEPDELKAEYAKLTSREDAIGLYGEKGAVMWRLKELSDQGTDIEITSPEEPDEEIVTNLVEKGVDLDAITGYLSLREAMAVIQAKAFSKDLRNDIGRSFYSVLEQTNSTWGGRLPPKEHLLNLWATDRPAFDALTDHVLDQFFNSFNDYLHSIGLADVTINYDTLTAATFDDEFSRKVSAAMDPMDFSDKDLPTNKASGAWNTERDRFLVRRMGDKMAKGKVPLVIFGASHAISTEPAVGKLIEVFGKRPDRA